MDEPIILTKVVKTCDSYPSQWDAWDKDGVYYYIRYRSGRGRIEREPLGKEHHNLNSEVIHQWDIDDGLDGIMTWSEVLTIFPRFVMEVDIL